MRLRATATIALSTLVGALLALPGQAVAGTRPNAAPNFNVWGAQNHYPQHRELELSAADFTSGAKITGITAHLHYHDATAGVPDVTVQGLSDTGYNFVWTTGALKLPQLGDWDVSADITDSLGLSETFTNIGTYHYNTEVKLSALSAAPTSIDYDHRQVTVSGTALLVDPRDDSTRPAAGFSVNLGVQNDPVDPRGITLSTGADGTFSSTVTLQGPITYVPNGITDPTRTLTTWFDLSNSVQQAAVTAVAEQTRIRITSPMDVKLPQGGSTVITGVLERLAGKTWRPAAKQTIEYTCGGYCMGTVGADANGVFQLTAGTAGSYYFDNYRNYSPFLTEGQNNTPVVVHIPDLAAISPISITEDEYGEAVIDGHLKLGPYGNETFGDSTHTVTVQYSADGRNWHNVGTTPIGRSGLAGDEFLCYATWNKQANGWWRVHWLGTPDFEAAYSNAFHLHRTPTRVTGGRPSATSVRHGSRLHFSGSLQQYTAGAWHAFGAAKVRLLFRPTGSSQWYLMASATTDRYGRYRISALDPRGGTWEVSYLWADGAHIDSLGPATWVRAR